MALRTKVGTPDADNIYDNTGLTGSVDLIGGLGNDTYFIDVNAQRHIIELAGQGTDTVVLQPQFGGAITYQLEDNIENFITDAVNDVAITGNGLANNIKTGAGEDTLIGSGGKDTLIGGDGDDTYYVDSTDDVITEQSTASSGHDRVFSTAAAYTLSANVEDLTLQGTGNLNGTGNASNNELEGNDGNNTLTGLAGDDDIDGNDGNDNLLGGDGNDNLHGGDGNDKLDGGNSNDILAGGDGTDSLLGGGDDDLLDGGDGIDTLTGAAGNDTYITDGIDIINEAANAGIDTVILDSDNTDHKFTLGINIENVTNDAAYTSITGNASNNIITGNNTNELLSGLAGADVLIGGGGSDTLVGGDGNDSYMVNSAGDVVTETNAAAAGGIDTVYSDINYILGNNVENLSLAGAAVRGTGNTLNNTLTGNSNNNTLVGGDGNDIISGGAYVLGKNAYMDGGNGNDTFMVHSASDRVIETATATASALDKVILAADFNGTSSGSFSLPINVEQIDASATTGGVNILGNNAANTITGGSGNDTINGGLGADSMAGGLGNDIYYADNAGDKVTELANGGTDTVYVSFNNGTAPYVLGANVENGVLLGNSQHMTGNTLNNTLTGDAADNMLIGLAGNDTLDGGEGIDTLNGGAGNDTYYVGQGDAISGETAATGTADIVFTSLDTFNMGNAATGAGFIENLTYTGSGNFFGSGNALSNYITGGINNDTLVGGVGAGNDTLDGGGNNAVFDSYGAVLVTGDQLNGGAGNDTYIMHLGDTIVDDTDGIDTFIRDFYTNEALNSTIENLTNQAGVDTRSPAEVAYNATFAASYLIGNDSANVLTANEFRTIAQGNGGNDKIFGGIGNDNLYGGDGNDSLVGSEGDNLINGGDGNDTMSGGAGDDSYFVDSAGDKITDTGGHDSVRVYGNSLLTSYTLAANLEDIIANDNFTATGNASDNYMAAGNSNRVQTFNGLAGNDTLVGGAGNDILKGGDGDDYLFGDFGDPRQSFLSTTGQNFAANYSDSLDGGNGNDILNAGRGRDTLAGGAGDDKYYVFSEHATITEAANQGTDTVIFNNQIIFSQEEITASASNAGRSTPLEDNYGYSMYQELNFTLGANVENLEVSGLEVFSVNELRYNGSTYESYSFTNELMTLTGNASDNIITANDDGFVHNISTLGGNDVINIHLQSGDVVDGGLNSDTLNAVIGNAPVAGVVANESVTSTITGIESIVLTALAGTSVSALDSSHSWNMGGFDGTGPAHNSITITGGGAIGLSGFGHNVDFTLQDYVRDVSFGGVNLSGVTAGWSGTDHLKITLDNVNGQLTAGNGLGSIDFTSTGDGIQNIVYLSGTDTTAIGVSGNVALELHGLNDDTTATVSAFSGDHLTLEADDGDDLSLIINNTITRIASDTAYDDVSMLLSGDNYLDLTDLNADEVNVANGSGNTASNMTTLVVAQDINATGYTGLLNIDASNSGSGLALTGGSKDDFIIGSDFGDTINGGTGADLMMGGDGNDTYTVDNAGDSVIEAPGEGTDQVNTSASYTLGTNLENLTLTGAGNINGTGNALDNNITGNSGNNLLNGGTGSDTLDGGLGNDTLIGGIGSDSLSGGDGTDSLSGGNGDDTLNGNADNDILNGDLGNDTLDGGLGNDTLNGGLGDDSLSGSDGTDSLDAGAGNDTLDGGIGADVMTGGVGDDVYFVDNTGDVVTEAADAGHDVVNASATFTLGDNVEDLFLIGSGDINGLGNSLYNMITGNSGDNSLSGGDGSDTLDGGAGDDTLDGGAGFDLLTGGADDDAFHFGDSSGYSMHTVTDFTGGDDVIELESSFSGLGSPGTLDSDNFFAGDVGSATLDAHAYILYDTGSGGLYYDADGSGADFSLVQFAQLDGAPTVTETDIHLF